MLLSILTPTLRERRHFFRRLAERLVGQLGKNACLVPFEDNGKLTIGEKRQQLLEEAKTPYVAFVDDDDLVAVDYVRQITKALRTGCDVVGFRLRQYTDGALTGLTVHSLSEKGWYSELAEDGLYRYHRTPNHLNPVRVELARQIGYKALNSGEDADYSRRLYETFGSTMREVFIDDYLYDYLYRTRRPQPTQNPYDPLTGKLTLEGAERIIAEGGSVMWNGRVCSTLEQLT